RAVTREGEVDVCLCAGGGGGIYLLFQPVFLRFALNDGHIVGKAETTAAGDGNRRCGCLRLLLSHRLWNAGGLLLAKVRSILGLLLWLRMLLLLLGRSFLLG